MSSLEIYQNQILNSINMGLIVLDADTKILMWNAWMEKHSGISSQYALQHTITTVFPSPPSIAFTNVLKNSITYGLPAILSNALHRSPLPLFTEDEGSKQQVPIHQSITITTLNADAKGMDAGAVATCYLIQVTDSSTSIRREKMLRSHSEVLKKDATTDSLTGLYNRRFFDEHYKIALGQAIRQKHPLSIFMIDIDYFKQYNDYYGHPAGDKILIKVAATLKTQISRSSDMLARYGGEEFAVVLPSIDADGALQVAQRVREAVRGLAIPHVDSVFGVVTVSVGVACAVPSQGSDHEALVKSADIALYQAKHAGRDRVALAPHMQPDNGGQ